MLSRDNLIADVETRLRVIFEAGLSGETFSMATELVDQVLLPALEDFRTSDDKTRMATVVDMAVQSHQAAISRQRDIIDRLKQEVDSIYKPGHNH